MTRLRGTLAAAGLCMGWLAAAAVAVPPVLDRVPDNAMVVIAAPGAEAVQKNVQALVTATELPIAMLPKVEDLLAMAGITEGLDTTKSFAIVVFPPAPKAAKAAKLPEAADKPKDDKEPAVDIQPTKGEADEGEGEDDDAEELEMVVALVPTSSYEALLKNFDTKPEAGNAIATVTMPDGETGYFKDVGDGYAAVSPVKSLLESFQAKSGAAALKGKLGKAGTALADSGDLIVIANMDQLRPMWPEIKKEMAEKIEEGAEGLPMPETPNPLENPAFNFVAESVVRDGQAMVLALRTGSSGVKLDLAANFSDGSPMAKVFTGNASAGKLMSKLPTTPYLLAAAMDLTGTGIRAFMKELSAKNVNAEKDLPLGFAGTMKPWEDSDGFAMVMGVPPGGIMGGLTTGTIFYTATRDPAAFIAAQKKTMTELDGTTEQGMKLAASYKEAAQKIEGIDVDEYSIRMTVDPDADETGGMAGQMINGIFGPTGGPAGFVAKTDSGIYQTMGRNSALLTSAIKAGAGGEGLGADKMLAQVGQSLPSNRIAEGYIGTQGLLDVALPFAAAFMGIQIPPEQIPASLPPIGMSLAGAEGSAHLSLFVPAPVISSGMKIATTIQEQMGGEFGEGEGEEAPAGDKGKTGQPKF